MEWGHVDRLRDPLQGQCPILLPGSAHPRVPRSWLSCTVCPQQSSLRAPAAYAIATITHPRHWQRQRPRGQPPGAPDTATLRSGQKGRTTKNDIYAPFLSQRTSNESTKRVALTLIPCAGQRGSDWELRARAQ